MTLKSTTIKIKTMIAATVMASTSRLNWANSKICSIFRAPYNWHVNKKILSSEMKSHVITGWCTAKIHNWLLFYVIGFCFYAVDSMYHDCIPDSTSRTVNGDSISYVSSSISEIRRYEIVKIFQYFLLIITLKIEDWRLIIITVSCRFK